MEAQISGIALSGIIIGKRMKGNGESAYFRDEREPIILYERSR